MAQSLARSPVPEDPGKTISDAYSCARDRIGKIAAIVVIIWLLFEAGSLLLNGAVYLMLYQLKIRLTSNIATVAFGLPLLMIGGLLSRLGLAIPELMTDERLTISHALKISIRKTENWEFFFILFLVKSALIGFALSWIANTGLGLLWDRGILTSATFGWVQSAVYIVLAAALESPLFIAFAVLHRQSESMDKMAVPAAIG